MNDHAKVLFFATLRDKTGIREVVIEYPAGSLIADIKMKLLDMYPNLGPSMETIIVAMNHEFAFDDSVVQDGAEIALFPPVSGG
jgi:molybdopterin converting factor subunit 1